MRAWKALGVVETIYEEELFEDSSISSSSFLSPSNSSPPSPLHSRIQSWSQSTGRKPDVLIHVQGTCFHLHKDPLTSKSIYLRRHLTSESSELTLSPPLNITAETFALVADFCYDAHILITPFNVAALRTAAELLDMSAAYGGDGAEEENLWQITESYFRRAVGVNKEYASIVLRSCLGLLPESETTASLVSRSVEALGLTGDGVVSLFDDVKKVGPEDFRAMAMSMHRRFMRHDFLYWIVDFYLKEHHGELSEEEKTRICNCIDCNKLSPRLLIHAVQNPSLSLRFLVRAMLLEQLNTRHSIISISEHQRLPRKTTTTHHHHHHDKNKDVVVVDEEDPITLGAILERDAALHKVAQLKAAMEATSSRIQSLEKELNGMKELCLLHDHSDQKPRNRLLDSVRSASFHYGSSTENKIERGERGSNSSASLRFNERREVAGGGSSSSECSLSGSSPRVQKNIRQRFIDGLKSAFRVSKAGSKRGCVENNNNSKVSTSKVGGGGDGDGCEEEEEDHESEEIVVIQAGHRRTRSSV